MTTTETKPSDDELKPGVYPDVPFDVYANWAAVNNSKLSAAAISPAHFWHQKPLNPKLKPLRVGRLVHAGKLEPHLLAEHYAVMPDYTQQVRTDDGEVPKNPRATKQYKELVQRFEAANEGKEIVSKAEYDEMLGMITALATNPDAARWFTGHGEFESCVIGQDPYTGMLCKSRIDFWRYDDVLVDLKTTQDATKFERHLFDYGYHRQAAFYLDVASWATGRKLETFVLAAIEKEPPYSVRAAPLSPALLAAGREQYRGCLNAIHAFSKRDAPGLLSPQEWTLPSEPARISINGQLIEVR